MKRVLLVSDGFFHPPFLARKVLHKTLAELDGFEFQHVSSMENLPGNFNEFSALVIYVHHKQISVRVLALLDEFVSSGGGILGVHSATASFQEQLHYFEILGGRFIGHGPVALFEVKPVLDSIIFEGMPAFTVKDELYLHELQPGITPHFTATHEGREVPIVWTYRYGQGRVCYAVPGHRTETIRNKVYQGVLQRGLMWACNIDK